MPYGGPVCPNCGVLDGHTDWCLRGETRSFTIFSIEPLPLPTPAWLLPREPTVPPNIFTEVVRLQAEVARLTEENQRLLKRLELAELLAQSSHTG